MCFKKRKSADSKQGEKLILHWLSLIREFVIDCFSVVRFICEDPPQRGNAVDVGAESQRTELVLMQEIRRLCELLRLWQLLHAGPSPRR